MPEGDDTQAIKITTMQDDLKSAKSGDTPAPETPPPTAPPKKLDSPVLPKPPKANKKGGGSAGPVEIHRSDKGVVKKIASWLVFILFVSLLSSGAGFASWWFVSTQLEAPTTSPQAIVAAPTEIIPATAQDLIKYDLASQDHKQAVQTAWDAAAGNLAPSAESLLTGDPRLLLDDLNLTEIYYLTLPNQTRPYLVVPQTENTSRLFSSSPSATLHNGWFIAHSLSPDTFLQELNKSPIGDNLPASFTAPLTSAPIRFNLSQTSLHSLIESLFSDKLITTQSSSLAGAIRISISGDQPSFEVSIASQSESSSPEQVSQANLDGSLLQQLPVSATNLWLGTDFYSDLIFWLDNSQAFSSEATQSAAVQSLLEQLDTPYAFAKDASLIGTDSWLVAIQLPPALSGELALGDPALEQALTALIPLATGRQSIPPLAFSEGVYNQLPLKFANLTGTSQALDYAVTDTHILIGTSKETMFALIDAFSNTADNLSQTEPQASLLGELTPFPTTSNLLLTSDLLAPLVDLFPLPAGDYATSFDPASGSGLIIPQAFPQSQ